jgi:hypothetical protein
MPLVRIIIVSALATILAIPSRAAEKLTWHPKLGYRQIGGGYLLALEMDRRPKTFFLCGPNKTDCISTKEIGWRKPFIIVRSGAVLMRSYDVVDTSATAKPKHPVNKSLASHLMTIPIYPAAIAWEKLGSNKPFW